MKCINCNAEIKDDAMACPFCCSKVKNDYVKGNAEISKFLNFINLLKNKVVCIFFLLISFSIFIVGCYCIYKEREQSKNYIETSGVLIDYISDDEYYTGVYKYVVDGENYTVSPKMKSDMDSFEKYEIVRYNPNNPEEAIIYANWEFVIIGGGLVSILFFLILFSNKIKLIIKRIRGNEV